MILVLIVCSIYGGSCRDAWIDDPDRAMTPMSCITSAQTKMAQWKAEHPGLRIEKFRCVDPNRMERGA